MYNNAMYPNADDYGVLEKKSIFDLDALNRGFFEAELGACQGKQAVSDSMCGTTGQGIPTVSSNYMPTAFPGAALPPMNSNPTAYMPEAAPSAAANRVLGTTATSKPLYPIVPDSSPSMPVTPPRHTNFNPYAELLRGSSADAPATAAPNMPNPGTLSVNPAFEQYGNQPHTGMTPPLMMPNAVPPFPIGLNYPSGKRKNMKTTAYEIMDDLISRLPIFTHKQTVYIYDETGGYYKETPQYEVEHLIMELYRWIIKNSGNGSLIEQVYKLLLKEPRIVRNVEPLSDPTKVSFANCTVDLETKSANIHSMNNVVTHALNCDLARFAHQSEDCPLFDKLLQDISGGDVVLEQRIWEIFGYCLTPDVNGKVFFVFQGVPNSGKSLLCNLLGSFFPPDKVSALSVHSLREQFALGNLNSAALCLSPDMPFNALDPKSASVIKQLTGHDKVSAAVKYKSNAQFRFEGKLILASNYPLLTVEPDDAFMQRAVVVPFLHAIPKSSQNHKLLELLMAERPAIASKALEAYFRLRDNHYNFSGSYAVNSSLLYPENLLDNSEITPLVYNFLLNNFEKDPEGILDIETAYQFFTQNVSNQFSMKMFSSAFRRFAEEIFDAQAVRSRMSSFTNARSCIRGIRTKQQMSQNS